MPLSPVAVCTRGRPGRAEGAEPKVARGGRGGRGRVTHRWRLVLKRRGGWRACRSSGILLRTMSHTSPAVNRRILPAATRISRSQRSESRDMHALCVDALAAGRGEGPAGHEVHRALKNALEREKQIDVAVKGGRAFELHDDVHVAPGPRLVAGDRSEEGEGAQAERGQLLAAEGEEAKGPPAGEGTGRDAGHGDILARSEREWE